MSFKSSYSSVRQLLYRIIYNLLIFLLAVLVVRDQLDLSAFMRTIFDGELSYLNTARTKTGYLLHGTSFRLFIVPP